MTKTFKMMDQEKREKIAEIVAESEAAFDAVYRKCAGHIGIIELDLELERLFEIATRIHEGPSEPDDPEAKTGTWDANDEPRLA